MGADCFLFSATVKTRVALSFLPFLVAVPVVMGEETLRLDLYTKRLLKQKPAPENSTVVSRLCFNMPVGKPSST